MILDKNGIEKVLYLSSFHVIYDKQQFMNTIDRVDALNIVYYKTHHDDFDKDFVLYFVKSGSMLLHYAVDVKILRLLKIDLDKNPHQSTLDIVNRFFE
jgi:hypothetical protein